MILAHKGHRLGCCCCCCWWWWWCQCYQHSLSEIRPTHSFIRQLCDNRFSVCVCVCVCVLGEGEGFQLTPNYSILISGESKECYNLRCVPRAHTHARTSIKRKQHVKEFCVFKNKKCIIIIIIIIIFTNYNFGF